MPSALEHDSDFDRVNTVPPAAMGFAPPPVPRSGERAERGPAADPRPAASARSTVPPPRPPATPAQGDARPLAAHAARIAAELRGEAAAPAVVPSSGLASRAAQGAVAPRPRPPLDRAVAEREIVDRAALERIGRERGDAAAARPAGLRPAFDPSRAGDAADIEAALSALSDPGAYVRQPGDARRPRDIPAPAPAARAVPEPQPAAGDTRWRTPSASRVDAMDPRGTLKRPPRKKRAGSQTITWQRFAVLALAFAMVGGAGVALQSLASRNDDIAETGPAAGEVAASNVVSSSEMAGAQPAPRSAAPYTPVPQLAATTVQPAPVSLAAVPSAPAPAPEAAPPSAPAPAASVALARAAPLEDTSPASPALALQAETPEPASPIAVVEPPLGRAGTDAPVQDTSLTEAPEAASAAVPLPRPKPPAPRVAAQPAAVPPAAAEPVEVAAASPAASGSSSAVEDGAPSGEDAAAGTVPAAGDATIRSSVTLRAQPGNGGAALATLKAGQKVTVVSCNIWCQIVADGKTGYVFKRFVNAGG
ncbi:SH3 domain-containing protein [Ancylobacter lacus]|uniref:SH3 domain-containing protein n=1 Tax=Ancylobacter lacus TaxID=2579970 RepID=UPI001BCF6017|nr:SH3 domain-containing protein [Ancylobacter lacus]MBS7538637.1 SH3 domain-containing protein [Ancylobacter lacus]